LLVVGTEKRREKVIVLRELQLVTIYIRELSVSSTRIEYVVNCVLYYTIGTEFYISLS
jgi:hypothetical protein